MVQLSPTAASQAVVRIYRSGTSDPPANFCDAESSSMDHNAVARIARELHSHDSRYALDVLLRGTSIHLPKNSRKQEPSREYVTLMEKLRHEQEEKLYTLMLNTREERESAHSITKEISDRLSVILNVLFSACFTGLAIWYATANLSTYKHREPLRVGASIAVAIIVAIAEITLFSSYLRKMEDAKLREQSRPEVKGLLQEPSE